MTSETLLFISYKVILYHFLPNAANLNTIILLL